MSKMVGSIPAFELECKRVASDFCSNWAKRVICYYDGSSYSRRDFVIKADHSWGAAYCNWTDKAELKRMLREVGATNIIGRIEWNYIDIAFDISPKALKKYRPNM